MGQLNSLAASRTSAVGFGARAGRIALVGAWALLVIGALLGDKLRIEAWVIIPLAAGLVGGLLVTTPGANRLRKGIAGAVVVCAVTAATVLFAMQPHSAPLWMYSMASYLVAALGARGNFLAAGAGSALVWGMGIIWAWHHGADAGEYLALLTIPVLVVVLVVWNRAITRIALRRTQYRSEAERALLDEAAAEKVTTRSRQELILVRRQAGPLLARLAEGEHVTRAFQLELSIAEATIRDRIRSARLLHPVLETAVLEVRRRGGTVILMSEMSRAEADRSLAVEMVPDYLDAGSVGYPDDGADPETISEGLARAVASRVHPHGAETSITIRTMPRFPGTELSLLVKSEANTMLTRFAADGRVISES
ncbi:MAG: hypothetical protein ACTHZ9_07125 [Leucobacter sp.]